MNVLYLIMLITAITSGVSGLLIAAYGGYRLWLAGTRTRESLTIDFLLLTTLTAMMVCAGATYYLAQFAT